MNSAKIAELKAQVEQLTREIKALELEDKQANEKKASDKSKAQSVSEKVKSKPKKVEYPQCPVCGNAVTGATKNPPLTECCKVPMHVKCVINHMRDTCFCANEVD